MASVKFSIIKKTCLVFLLFNIFVSKIYSQFDIRDSSISFPVIGLTAAYQVPGGDMAKRFGNNINTGGVFLWKFRSDWVVGIEGDFLFGDNVRENDILDKYRTPDGNFIDGTGQYSTVTLSERGLKFEVKGGKIFQIIGPNKNSGLMTTFGAGYLQHKIRIDTPGGTMPYLQGDYSKGYDRLSTGLSLTEFIGYIFFSNKKLINFYGGFEATEAFTKNVREVNFDTGLKDNQSRVDLLFGLRFGWIFPIYKRMADKYYFN